jgi:hypothetical protein
MDSTKNFVQAVQEFRPRRFDSFKQSWTGLRIFSAPETCLFGTACEIAQAIHIAFAAFSFRTSATRGMPVAARRLFLTAGRWIARRAALRIRALVVAKRVTLK